MSEEGSFGVTASEKLFGLILVALGIVTLYYTLTSAGALLAFTGFFGFLSFIIIILGVALIIAKVE
jgi:hypothetical protein